MKRKETRGSLPLLGFLMMEPMTGYELKKTVDRTVSHFWSEGFGSIYPSLKEFAAESYIEEAPDTLSPARANRRYAITESGRSAFLAWLRSPLESFDIRRNEMLMRLFFSAYLSEGEITALLSDYRRVHEMQLERYTAVRGEIEASVSGQRDKLAWLGCIEHGIALSRALVAWCGETERGIRGN